MLRSSRTAHDRANSSETHCYLRKAQMRVVAAGDIAVSLPEWRLQWGVHSALSKGKQ